MDGDWWMETYTLPGTSVEDGTQELNTKPPLAPAPVRVKVEKDDQAIDPAHASSNGSHTNGVGALMSLPSGPAAHTPAPTIAVSSSSGSVAQSSMAQPPHDKEAGVPETQPPAAPEEGPKQPPVCEVWHCMRGCGEEFMNKAPLQCVCRSASASDRLEMYIYAIRTILRTSWWS